MAELPPTGEAWPGNLPCCHGQKDGCAAHNPSRLPIFWNPSLPSPIKPVTDGFFKSLLTRKNDSNQKQTDLEPTITSVLPQTPSSLDPLPLIHPSVPYTLSLYHLHALTTATTPAAQAALLNAVTCHGATSSSHPLTWKINPIILPPSSPSESPNTTTTTLLLLHTITLPITLPLGAASTLADTSTYSYQKLPLVSPLRNTYTFRVCPHASHHLRALTLKVAKGVASIRVEHTLKQQGGQEVKGEWRSEVKGGDDGIMGCGMCYTDFGMGFVADVKRGEVRVTLRVWKDLGGGITGMAAGEYWKWEAARGGRQVEREKGDFGRVRRVFEAALEARGRAVERSEERAVVGAGVEVEMVKGGEVIAHVVDDEGMHVADGARPPPPYTP